MTFKKRLWILYGIELLTVVLLGGYLLSQFGGGWSAYQPGWVVRVLSTIFLWPGQVLTGAPGWVADTMTLLWLVVLPWGVAAVIHRLFR
ncbi:hypothetical protein CF392_02825 [Tamilnaduibacter salinus]|uniref:Uncharacterized protein n=1 Tax=Tamilnaduibacter salinus TaxID=1484056 RepID=A0A2A2I678_9GAMM|nr:hypothetical protein [Tamilnaduibacter salinus]PAV27082.1 hypothetical protein CF392_02825 [Tamilnaduibacter salinus]